MTIVETQNTRLKYWFFDININILKYWYRYWYWFCFLGDIDLDIDIGIKKNIDLDIDLDLDFLGGKLLISILILKFLFGKILILILIQNLILSHLWRSLLTPASGPAFFALSHGSLHSVLHAQVSKRCVEVWKVAKKALRWNVLFFFDAHAMLFTVCILGASSYETRRANDSASILVSTIVSVHCRPVWLIQIFRRWCRRQRFSLLLLASRPGWQKDRELQAQRRPQ